MLLLLLAFLLLSFFAFFLLPLLFLFFLLVLPALSPAKAFDSVRVSHDYAPCEVQKDEGQALIWFKAVIIEPQLSPISATVST